MGSENRGCAIGEVKQFVERSGSVSIKRHLTSHIEICCICFCFVFPFHSGCEGKTLRSVIEFRLSGHKDAGDYF